MKWLDLIPSWAYGLAVAGLLTVVVAQEVRVTSLKVSLAAAETEVAGQREAREVERRQRLEVLAAHREELSKIQAAHAAVQQENENVWTQKRLALEARTRDDAAQLDRLRKRLSAYTARGGRTGAPDAAPAVDQADRLEGVGRLFDESLELLVEGRQLIERRDAEVERLLGQIEADRNACQKGAVSTAAALRT